MNEQLQGKLVEILSAIQSSAKTAGDFALEQLPDIAQQYVMYGRVMSLVGCLILIAATVFLGWIIHRLSVWGKKADEPLAWLAMTFPGFGIAMAFIALWDQIATAGLVWFAPKVWLIKELAQLVKGIA